MGKVTRALPGLLASPQAELLRDEWHVCRTRNAHPSPVQLRLPPPQTSCPDPGAPASAPAQNEAHTSACPKGLRTGGVRQPSTAFPNASHIWPKEAGLHAGVKGCVVRREGVPLPGRSGGSADGLTHWGRRRRLSPGMARKAAPWVLGTVPSDTDP